MRIDLTKLAASIENTKRAGQFWARPVDQSHLDRLLEREVELENEHGPQVDPMAHVEFPFAENH